MKEHSYKRPIRILCLEDDDNDRMLLERALVADGLTFELVHAKTRNEFEAALAAHTFDLIISDFSLPSYDGMTALATARKVQGKAPFIFVSGTIGEERAVESLKNGATDYVLKDRRDRLVSAIQRALTEVRERAERAQLEEQLRQAQKMEAIGQLAGGVAHDFNNLLAVIQVNAELALMDPSKLDPEIRENLAEIAGATERAANLTRQLLAFGRKQAMRRHPIDLDYAINNLARMLKRIIGEDILLHCRRNQVAPFVHADISMIEQVLMNLVVNARDAMRNGGRLVIGTRKVKIHPKYAQMNPDANVGEFVCLSVRDTGCGIGPDNLPRIFEPFFTTKEVGKGTGLGLATVYGIAKQHGGWVKVSSRVGKGTVFHVFLPSLDLPAPISTPREMELPAQNGHGRILLVEDDPAVRLTTRRLLGRCGYQVIEAASGREALEIWHNQGPTIDLLLTDMVMPGGITGRDLVNELRKSRPLLKVVFMSGYSLNAIGNDTDFFQRESNHFLQKPYRAQALVDTVQRCLDQSPALTPQSARS